MIKIIAGEKGSGKTAKVVDDINEVALQDNNVVCIVKDNRLDQLLKPNVRTINALEYPVQGYDQLVSFIAGICSKDYDLTHIYVDSIYKVAGVSRDEDIVPFITKLDKFLKNSPITITLLVTRKAEDLPEELKSYVE